MRLSTAPDRNDDRAVSVLRAALDAGITWFDTANSYGLDDADRGHNERMIARAISEWGGDRSTITIATKGGMRRPKGEWIPDGRAKHLRESCAASNLALGQNTIDLYQLHVVDPKTPLATSMRALAKLREDGWVRDVGLCNVTISQIREAQSIAPISSVQVSLSPFDDENLRNGVAEYCRENGIRLIAYRPLGGERRKSFARDIVVRAIADRHGASPEETVLAWLQTFGPGVVPLPGATRIESVSSIARSVELRLTENDRAALDAKFSGRLLRVPRSERRPKTASVSDVVVVMGMPGAGKSTLARELEADGYVRLNRDDAGGRLADLVPRLDDMLASGKQHIVLDNTYPSRASRNEVIETAWQHDAHVRCIWLKADIGQAQVNAIHRMIDVHGSLPTPEEIKQRSRQDTRYLLPDAQFRYERALEPPTTEEGFEAVEPRPPFPYETPGRARGLILDLDDLIADPTRLAGVAKYASEGWFVFVHVWRPQVARGALTAESVRQEFASLRESLGFDFDFAHCPHDAGPPICWCRKPIPGQVIEFAVRRGVALNRSLVIGTSTAARTMAERVGARVKSDLR